MKRYQTILVAVELETEGDEAIIEKAKQLAAQFNAQLTLIHAIEQVGNYGAAYGIAAGIDIEEELTREAAKMISALGAELNLSEDHQIVKVGPAKVVILEEAQRLSSDLIVVGSHGRHGVRLLLGSTANAVLHSAKCDVLAVRVKG